MFSQGIGYLLHNKTKQDPCSCLYFFVPSIPRDLGFFPCTATGRSPDLSSSLTAAPFKPSRISPVAYIKSSRNTVTRSRRIYTCFPFHLHGKYACRHHPLYLLCYNTTNRAKEKLSSAPFGSLCQNIRKDFHHVLDINRLGNVCIHPGLLCLLDVLGKGVGRHGNYRYVFLVLIL